MLNLNTGRWAAAALIAVTAAAGAYAQTTAAPTVPRFAPDGTVHVPAFELPPSAFLSEEARAQQRARATMPVPVSREQIPDIVVSRKLVDGAIMPRVAEMRQIFPVDVVEDRIGGVPVRVLTPKNGGEDPERVLINLHGGAFSVCWDACSLVESIPIAALGKYRVVSVNYRMAPEHRHPAGVEDAAAVYRELLKRYPPGRIGVFGCSAGGVLTSQLAAWLPLHGLPQMSAAGIFGGGAVRFGVGDSAYIAGYVDGSFPPPPKPGEREIDMIRGYFTNAALDGPIVSPGLHPEVLAKFPPTLLITGTRAIDMSPVIVTNSRLLKAGIKSTLIVGEGMGHCYMYQPDLPESRDAYAATVAFFHENLR